MATEAKVRSRLAVTIDGVEYKSRTEAAKALVAAGKSLSETATAVNMTYQTVYSVTKGAEKVKVRRAKYRILSLGKSGRKTAGEISKKVGVSTSKVVSILKKAGIEILTKEAKAKAEAEKTTTKKAPKAKKTSKAKKEQPVIVPVEEVATEIEATEIPADESAMEAAMADMANEDNA